MPSKLIVANVEQKILFLSEMKQQITDGWWETNSKSADSWKYWNVVEVVVDPNQVGTIGIPAYVRRNYNFSNKQLLDAVGERIRTTIENAIGKPYNRSQLRKDCKALKLAFRTIIS